MTGSLPRDATCLFTPRLQAQHLSIMQFSPCPPSVASITCSKSKDENPKLYLLFLSVFCVTLPPLKGCVEYHYLWNHCRWLFMEALAFTAYFGILLLRAESSQLELILCFLTVFSISTFSYILADMDCPFHGIFRVNLDVLLQMLDYLETQCSVLQADRSMGNINVLAPVTDWPFFLQMSAVKPDLNASFFHFKASSFFHLDLSPKIVADKAGSCRTYIYPRARMCVCVCVCVCVERQTDRQTEYV